MRNSDDRTINFAVWLAYRKLTVPGVGGPFLPLKNRSGCAGLFLVWGRQECLPYRVVIMKMDDSPTDPCHCPAVNPNGGSAPDPRPPASGAQPLAPGCHSGHRQQGVS